MTRAEALTLLGLAEGFDTVDLRRARRHALIAHHPDHGGSRESIDAVEQAVALLIAGATKPDMRVRRGSDHPSFTVDALPVETFELLLLATGELGEVVDDDPPYRLEVLMTDPHETWVRFEVVPDAGSSTVSLAVEATNPIDIEKIRDVWVAAINALQPL